MGWNAGPVRLVATRTVAGAAIVLLGGCSGTAPGTPTAARPIGPSTASTSEPSPAHRSPVTGPPSAADAPSSAATVSPGPSTDACAAFHRFYDDLRTRGPGAVHQLLPEAQAVQQAAGDAAAFGDAADASFLDDANALVDYVDQADFPTSGTVAADPVQEVLQDCP